MRLLRVFALVSSTTLAMASTAVAQTPPAAVPAPKPPAQAPPVALFPAEARFAFIDFQRVAIGSAPGKVAARILKEFTDKKMSELEGQNKQLQALTAKRDAGVLTGPALARMARDVEKLQREVEFARQSAQAEFQQMETDLQRDLQTKVIPIVAEIARERNLHAVFTSDSGFVYVLPALDISDEVIKRVDAQPKKGG